MFNLGRICDPPFYSTTGGGYVDTSGPCDPCGTGMVISPLTGECTINVSVTGTLPPTPVPGTNPFSSLFSGSNSMIWIIGGGLLLLLAAFGGGRASKSTGSKLVSRTSTRSIFA